MYSKSLIPENPLFPSICVQVQEVGGWEGRPSSIRTCHTEISNLKINKAGHGIQRVGGLTAKVSSEQRPQWSESLHPAGTHGETGVPRTRPSRAQAKGMVVLACFRNSQEVSISPEKTRGNQSRERLHGEIMWESCGLLLDLIPSGMERLGVLSTHNTFVTNLKHFPKMVNADIYYLLEKYSIAIPHNLNKRCLLQLVPRGH